MKLHIPFKNWILVCAVMMLSVCLAPEAAALSGAGTQSDPYIITTATELEQIHQDLDACYALGNNLNLIDTDWTPVGSTAEGAFTGTLDGQGYTISNLILRLEDDKYVGLFGYLEGTVTDLTLSKVSITGGRYVGAVAGYTGVGGSVTDCHVTSGSLLSKGAPISVSVGGVTGWCDGEVNRCTNAASVTAKSGSYPVVPYAGGIAGYVSSPQQVQDCSNSGSINVQSYTETFGYAGGLFGWLSGESSAMTDCSNSGKVTGSESGGNRGYAIQGGLVGGVSADAALLITRGTNTGTIGADYLGQAGGITGRLSGGSVTLNSCENKGTLTGRVSGGMIGNTDSASGQITMTSCTNSGPVSGIFAGGTIGSTSISAAITSCSNTAAITSNNDGSSGGGMVAYCSGADLVIDGCTNTGDVGKQFSCAGGMVGDSRAGTLTISACTNSASVTALNSASNVVPVAAGGMVANREGGVKYQLTCTITNCENTGKITATDAYALYPRSGSGGILGYSSEATSSIDSCVNRGAVSIDNAEHANASYVHAGGITGHFHTSGTLTVSNCTNFATVTGRNAHGVAGHYTTLGENNVNLGQLISSYSTSAGAQVSIALRSSPKNYPAGLLDISDAGLYLGSGTPGLEPVELVHGYTHQSKTVDTTWSLAQLLDPESGAYENWDLNGVTFDEAVNSGLPTPSGVTMDYMDQSVLILKEGDTAALTAPFTVSKWTVSDGRVTCSNGKVTALENGASCVTAVSADGRQANTIVLIYSTEDTSLSKTEVTLYPAGSTTLSLQTDDPRGAVWSSSDTSVATVSTAGVVTAHVPGTAVITAAIPLTGQVLECTVNVVPAPISKITLYGRTIPIGESAALSKTITPTYYADTIKWSSSIPEIATVDEDGVVTGVSVGQTTITANAGNGVTATCTVTVNRPAETLTLDRNTLTLEMGYTDRLTATMTPEDTTDTITWSSSHSNVTVSSDGTLTPKRVGTVTITARSSSGLTASCVVTVKEAVVHASSVELSHTQLRPVVGEKIQLTASVLPENATETAITWTSSNDAVAAVNVSGVVEAVSVGTATITATAPNGVYSTCEVVVSQASSACFVVDSGRFHLSETAETPVRLLRNPGIAAFTVEIPYDSTLMKPVDVIPSALLSVGTLTSNLEAIEAGTADTLSVTWYHDSDVTGDGEAFVICWEPVGQPGTVPVSLLLEQDDVCNSEGYCVRTGTQAGTLLLIDYYVGDVYRDEAVNMMDIVYLARWFNDLEEMDETQILAADINYDGTITVADLTAFAQMLTESLFVQPFAMLMSMAEEEPIPYTVTVSDGTLSKDGLVPLTVSGRNCPGISAFRFALNIPEGYSIHEVKSTALLDQGTFVFNEETGIAIWYSTETVDLDGDLFTVTLSNPNDVAYGGQFTLTHVADDFFAAGEEYHTVPVETTAGGISVADRAAVQSAAVSGSVITAVVESNSQLDVLLIAASYEGEQMCTAAVETCQLSVGRQTLTIELEAQGESCKLFILDAGQYIPLDTYHIP